MQYTFGFTLTVLHDVQWFHVKLYSLRAKPALRKDTRALFRLSTPNISRSHFGLGQARELLLPAHKNDQTEADLELIFLTMF